MTTLRRKTSAGVLGLTALAVLAVGCGKLSKNEAEAKIKKSFFSAESYMKDLLWCEWSATIQVASGANRTFKTIGDPQGGDHCIVALSTMGALKGDSSAFTVGPKGMLTKRLDFWFACGKRQFREIKSITTGDKKATVSYIRINQVDEGTLKTVEPCQLQNLPKDGDMELTAKFKKDDDGNWNIVE